jgi:hypothetical protein
MVSHAKFQKLRMYFKIETKVVLRFYKFDEVSDGYA